MSSPTPPPGVRYRDQDGFDDLILAAAENLDVQPLAVEKDYWVCETLRALATAYPDNIVFKGGTSLEKLRIIRRFSEDLDLLVVGDIGGTNKAKNTLKKMVAVAGAATGDSTPERHDAGGDPGTFHRSAYVRPDLKNASTGGIADPNSVLIELGQVGGPNPHDRHQVTSLLASQLDGQLDLNAWADLAPFDVTILHPGRTLIEKLLRVNNFALRPKAHDDLHGWPRIGRQFYDIWALLGNDNVQALLADATQVADIIASAHEASRAIKKPDEPIPVGGFAASPAFDPGSHLAERLRQEHDTAIQNLYYGDAADAPSFDDVLNRIHQNAALLNPIG